MIRLRIMPTVWTTTIIIGKCIHCDYIDWSGGITRLKQHLDDDYPNVAKYKKVMTKIYQLF